MFFNPRGQTLVELIVVVAAGAVIIVALTFAVIFSLRNAQFAKNQSQATKLAQEGIELVRSVRNRDGSVIFTYSSGTTVRFSDLWNVQMSLSCAICYFRLNTTNNSLNQVTAADFEDLGNNLKRQVQIKDDSNFAKEKTITVIVGWSDFSQDHYSQLSTVFSKP